MVLGDESNLAHRNSMKLDLSEAPNAAADSPKETYRPIPEYPLVEEENKNESKQQQHDEDGKSPIF